MTLVAYSPATGVLCADDRVVVHERSNNTPARWSTIQKLVADVSGQVVVGFVGAIPPSSERKLIVTAAALSLIELEKTGKSIEFEEPLINKLLPDETTTVVALTHKGFYVLPKLKPWAYEHPDDMAFGSGEEHFLLCRQALGMGVRESFEHARNHMPSVGPLTQWFEKQHLKPIERVKKETSK